MKKILFTIISVIIFGFANGQNATKPQFGLKGGFNFSSFNESGSGVPTMKFKTDFGVGFFVTVKFADKWDVQPEINYSRQGSKYNINNVYSNGDSYNFTNSFNLYYVNIPILFKYNATNNFSLEFGPQLGLLTEANLLVNANGSSNAQDFKRYFTDYDFSLDLGANYEFNKSLFVNIRFAKGLNNIFVQQSNNDTVFKNNVFSFCLGARFK